MSILNALMSLAAPVGLLVMTPLGKAFGVRSVFVITGALGAAVSMVGFLSRVLLGLGRFSTTLTVLRLPRRFKWQPDTTLLLADGGSIQINDRSG